MHWYLTPARRALLGALGALGALSAAGPAAADPEPPRAPGDVVAKPGAAALGPGTIFLTEQPLRSNADGRVFVSMGQALQTLPQPVGSCRLRVRVPGSVLAAGTPLTVEEVASQTSPYANRGISSVTWTFAESDPAESMVCDDVGNEGLGEGDIRYNTDGVLRIEPARLAD